MGANKAGVDLVLIQPILLYVNPCSSLAVIFSRNGKRVVSKQGQPQPHVHSEARVLSS